MAHHEAIKSAHMICFDDLAIKLLVILWLVFFASNQIQHVVPHPCGLPSKKNFILPPAFTRKSWDSKTKSFVEPNITMFIHDVVPHVVLRDSNR